MPNRTEAEVNNGGFNQFYFNSSGIFSDLAPEAFRRIGAPKFADLMNRANQLYRKENETITEKLDGTLEGFSDSYKNNPLNKLDDEFYELYEQEDLLKLQIGYIRKNKDKFVDL